MELGKQCYFDFHEVKDVHVEVTVKSDMNLLKN